MIVFYSWQNDIDVKINRNFIKDCIENAIKLLKQEYEILDPIRLDHDTKDVSGSPDIVPTIFEKIEKCDVFIGDITFIACSAGGKYCSNPNVLIELGYAFKSIGGGRVINVMNTKFGKPDGNMPFDLTHKRWPIQYELGSDDPETKPEIKKSLTAAFKAAIYPFINQRKTTSPAFQSNADKIRHREHLRKEFEDELLKIHARNLRRDVVIRDVDRVDGYPNIDENEKGISPWFRVGILETYTKGIKVGLSIGALTQSEDGLRYTDHKNDEEKDITAYLIGEIPFDSIVTVNWEGDEYYYFPHIYCHFNHDGQPYERLTFCEKIDMGHGHDYYKVISDYKTVHGNSIKAKVEFFA